MQSGGKVCIYAKPQPLFAKLTKLQTLFAKPLEGYFLLFFANRAMQSLFAKPLKILEHPIFREHSPDALGGEKLDKKNYVGL